MLHNLIYEGEGGEVTILYKQVLVIYKGLLLLVFERVVFIHICRQLKHVKCKIEDDWNNKEDIGLWMLLQTLPLSLTMIFADTFSNWNNFHILTIIKTSQPASLIPKSIKGHLLIHLIKIFISSFGALTPLTICVPLLTIFWSLSVCLICDSQKVNKTIFMFLFCFI